MIVDKNPARPPVPEADPPQQDREEYSGNPMAEITKAVLAILRDIRETPESEPFFLTARLDYKQMLRVTNSKRNMEAGFMLPAAFIHFINVRWLVQTSRIGEGRGELRIRYVLNRLDIEDDEAQMQGYHVFQLINNAINKNKPSLAHCTDRFQLTYWDQVENFDDGVQEYWITYDVWFKDFSSYRYRDYVDRYIVVPPFTTHADQREELRPDHADHKDPEEEFKAGFKEDI